LAKEQTCELPAAEGPVSLAAGQPAETLLALEASERLVALFSLDPDAPALAIGTAAGVAKRVVPDYKGWDTWEMIALKDGDEVTGAAPSADADELVFITSDAQLLRCPARSVRPQGRQAGGMAGVNLAPAARVLAFAAIRREDKATALVTTVAGGPDPADQIEWAVKTTPFEAFPAKGRATGGVRCHRFLKGQAVLRLAWAGPGPALACDRDGQPRNLPPADPRRDASGAPLAARLFAIG
jgi:DNA gyrase subunit A